MRARRQVHIRNQLNFPRRHLWSVLPALLLAVSCSPGADLQPLPSQATGPYLLDSGDQVRIVTFGEETLTGQFRVNDGGNIAVPLLGAITARGLSTAQLASRIEDELRAKNLIRSPNVSVEIIAYRPFFVLGEVNKPGEYPYHPGMTVLTAVAMAGGFTYRAVQQYASILRSYDGRPIEGRVPRSYIVEPGDVVTILERWI